MKSCISLYSYWKLVKKGEFTHFQAIDKTKELGIDAVEIQVFEENVPEGKTMAEYVKELYKLIQLFILILRVGDIVLRIE